ncbi:hypothetical protein EG329_010972 [Mollisiaceae sp. DMI_Dod_QoI]|nr:hypothetical protein EG329_010972 [Helotiales sp. DMI_Dod_QoI]
MPFVSEEIPADDDERRAEMYEEVDDDDSVKMEYERLMKETRDYNFDRMEDKIRFENAFEPDFGIKNQTHGTFLHYWAKSPPTEPPPPKFGKWLFSKRPSMIKEIDKDNRTPVHAALDSKSTDAQAFLKLVLDECPRSTLLEVLAQKDVGGNNCLHYAILRNSPWTLELIKACQSPSEKHLFIVGNTDKQTPLHLAMVPPRAKQQPPKFIRRQAAFDVRRGVHSEARRMSVSKDIGKDKEQRGQIPSEKPEFKDKETNVRNRDVNGVNKEDAVPELRNRNGTFKEAVRFIVGGGEQKPSDSGSNRGARIVAPSTSFPFQDVVQSLMKYGPEALWQPDSNKRTPYQYRLQLMSVKKNLTVEDDAMNRAVSEDLVARDMKEFCLRNLGRGDAMRSLYEKGKEKHIEFDLSGLPNLSISKSDLARLARHLTFEDTLQYVAIPRLRVEDPVTENSPLPSTSEHQSELKDSKHDSKTVPPRDCAGLKDAGVIFDWLGERGVNRIFKVIVIDGVDPPHSNQVIEERLKGFKIETWDWKKVDICSDTILEAAPGTRFLNLYASGNCAVLKGWSCSEGLVKLKMLEKIRLIVRPGFETEERRHKDVENFKTTLTDNWKKLYKKPVKEPPEVEVVWDDKEKSLTSWIQSDKAPNEKQRWLEYMDTFAEFVNNIDLDNEKKERSRLQDKEEKARLIKTKRTKQLEDIKVAIIDDGVDGFDPTVSQSIANGVSFCRDSSDLVRSYYVSSGGHGTMMARLVLRMCPTAKLYVARLQEYTSATGKRFITAESATDAVRWAITNGVQILSMSWTIEGNKNEPRIANFKKAIDEALAANITMMCAFSDQGMSAPADGTFPTAWKDECFRIGAATAAGDASTLVPKSQVDFLFPGENIIIEAEPSIATLPREPKSGSSISTALAAGTAAMLLFVTQLINAILYEKLKNPKTMKLAFERLGSVNNPQYFDSLKFSRDFSTPEWQWDQGEYRAGKGWDEVKKLVEQL